MLLVCWGTDGGGLLLLLAMLVLPLPVLIPTLTMFERLSPDFLLSYYGNTIELAVMSMLVRKEDPA